MTIRALIVSLALFPSAMFLTGCPNCEYESRCDGDSLKVCSVGVDQLAGDESRGTIPCDGENPVCVDLDRETAQCVRAGQPACDADFAEICEGNVAVRCHAGYQVAEDCAAAGNVCAVVAGAALCAFAPLAACDPATHVATCDGRGELACERGVVSRLDCADVDPHGICVVSRSEYGRSVYCGVD